MRRSIDKGSLRHPQKTSFKVSHLNVCRLTINGVKKKILNFPKPLELRNRVITRDKSTVMSIHWCESEIVWYYWINEN